MLPRQQKRMVRPVAPDLSQLGSSLCTWALCCRLNLSTWGGRCLEQDGTKARQWNWSGVGRVPTVLDPLHLSLNEKIQVRILGRGQVFLAFQACGEAVQLSVGRCCLEPLTV